MTRKVRQAPRDARKSTRSKDKKRKLAALRAATLHSFPAPDIDQMIREIEKGYQDRR